MNGFIVPRYVVDPDGSAWTVDAQNPGTYPGECFAVQGISQTEIVWQESGRWVKIDLPPHDFGSFPYRGNRIS